MEMKVTSWCTLLQHTDLFLREHTELPQRALVKNGKTWSD